MGPVDQTMPALFEARAGTDAGTFLPLAQLGAGPDGTVVLARRGERLLELHQLTFGPGTPRWAALEARVRAIAAVDHPAVRPVLAVEPEPPALVLEGDSFPPLAELIEQPSIDLGRILRVLTELARALAAAHHLGVFHGGIHPWSVWVGNGDRPRIELTALATRATHEPWVARCLPPEAGQGPGDGPADVHALGALLELFAAGRDASALVRAIARDALAPDPE
ncbi:MAG: hypothetical protein M3680_17800, partial [Myxococcota bacterium]|nr:hypothetical protein [Myxococcota bacterium]